MVAKTRMKQVKVLRRIQIPDIFRRKIACFLMDWMWRVKERVQNDSQIELVSTGSKRPTEQEANRATRL